MSGLSLSPAEQEVLASVGIGFIALLVVIVVFQQVGLWFVARSARERIDSFADRVRRVERECDKLASKGRR